MNAWLRFTAAVVLALAAGNARAEGPSVNGGSESVTHGGTGHAIWEPATNTLRADSSVAGNSTGVIDQTINSRPWIAIGQSYSYVTWEFREGIVKGADYVASVPVVIPTSGPDAPVVRSAGLLGSSLDPVVGGPGAEADLDVSVKIETPSIAASIGRFIACTDAKWVHAPSCSNPGTITFANTDTPVYTREGIDASPFIRVTVYLQSTSVLRDLRGREASAHGTLIVGAPTLTRVG